MKKPFGIVLFALIAFATFIGGSYGHTEEIDEIESYLLELELENFNDTINYYEQIVVGFYAPWFDFKTEWRLFSFDWSPFFFF